ncbi:MAG: hypothetical protein ABSD39_13585 [Terriglobales bacterium]|jgi:hypothetical protein
MNNWKQAAIAASAAAAVILLLKGKRPAAVLAGGIGMAVLASEYPDRFERFREEFPSYIRQGTGFVDLAMRIGSKIGELAENRSSHAFEGMGEY